VPAPAAQSLAPALEMPKHFSLLAASATFDVLSAIVDTAAATADARIAALKLRRMNSGFIGNTLKMDASQQKGK
jgi:hypothetical protein